MCKDNPDNIPLPATNHEKLLDEIEDQRIELIAIERLANPSDELELISHDDVRKMFK